MPGKFKGYASYLPLDPLVPRDRLVWVASTDSLVLGLLVMFAQWEASVGEWREEEDEVGVFIPAPSWQFRSCCVLS